MLEIPHSEPFYKKHAYWLLAAVLLVVVLLLAKLSWGNLKSGPEQKTLVATVDNGEVQRKVLGQGKLKARDNNAIISEVEGVVVEYIQYPGAMVHKGDNLLVLRNPDLLRAKEKSSLKLLEISAEHSSTLAELETKKAALINNVKIAESDIEFAQQEVSTLTSLLDSGGVAKLEYVRATSRLKKAKLQLSLATSNLELFKKTRTALEQASKYKLLAAEKELALAEFDLAQLTIKAGTNGVLGSYSESVEIGKMLARGEVLGQISNTESLYLDFFVSANDAALINTNMKTIVDIRGAKAEGRVLRVHPNVENNLVKVEAEITGDLPTIARENIDVLVEVIVESFDNTLRVKTPSNINSKEKEQTVYVINGDDIVTRKVIVGVVGKNHMQILHGINVGEKIVLNP